MNDTPAPSDPAPPSARPPWRVIALLLIVGAGLIGLGAASEQVWIGVLGTVPLASVPYALLLPALRISRHRRPQNGLRDMNFLGGWMSIWGFTAEERDAALTRRAPAPDQPPHSPAP